MLARVGRDESLRLLVDAYVADFSTYPADPPPLLPRARPGTWSGGPGLADALINADPSEQRVLERLVALLSKDPRWNQPAVLSLRASLGDKSAPAPPKADAKPGPEVHAIAKNLASKEPRERAEALAASGYHRIEAHYDEVLRTALTGAGEERMAALYGLGFYRHDIPVATLRRLIARGDIGSRFSALELATRTKPARFAAEAMTLLQEVAAHPRGGEQGMSGVDLPHLAQVLSRLTRGPLPQELLTSMRNKDAQVRWAIIRALGMGGNPGSFPYVSTALADTDEAVRSAAQSAVEALGGPEE